MCAFHVGRRECRARYRAKHRDEINAYKRRWNHEHSKDISKQGHIRYLKMKSVPSIPDDLTPRQKQILIILSAAASQQEEEVKKTK